MKVKSESEVALCDPMDCSLPGSSVHGTFQARVLEWGCHYLLKDQKYKGQGVRRKGSDRTIITLLYQEKCGIKARLDAFFLSRF